METIPEQMFQNHMVHHPLLQYQMLFPSLLMSLGTPPSGRGEDEEEFLMEGEGKVNSIDYLRFSALANQLAITQINQVLMDIVKEPEGGGERSLLELQKSLLENGFTQMNRHMTENKALVRSNNDVVNKLDVAMGTLQDTVAKGFLNTISEMLDIQGTVKSHSNQTVSQAKEFKGMLQSIANKVDELQAAEQNITYNPMNCIPNVATESEKSPINDDQNSDDSPPSNEILLQIQSDLQNLSKALENFIAANLDATAEREALKALIENCTKSSPEVPVIDVSNITRKMEEGLADNLREIKPHVQNLTNEIAEIDTSLLQTREDLRELQEALAANMSKSKEDLHNLHELTEMGFAELHAKLDSLSEMSIAPTTTETTVPHNCCPDGFFPIGKECFFMVTGITATYEEAEEYCKSISASLAEPESLLEFIGHIQKLKYNESLGLWLGGQEKDAERGGAESQSYQNPVLIWKTSGERIDFGWYANYPLKIDGGSCLCFIEMGLQNADCAEDREYICEFEQGCQEAFDGGFAIPDTN